MASLDGFLGDRLRRNVSQWLKAFDIHRHVGRIETGEGSEAALYAGRWLEASILASEWSGDPLLRQRTSGMLDRVLGAQQPGAGDPFPALRDPAHAAALIAALDAAEDIWDNGPAASAAERVSRFHPFPKTGPGIGFDLASLAVRLPRLQPSVGDDGIESLIWNRILPCQSPEGDAFRPEYTAKEFGGEDAGSAGSLLLARLPWWLYSVGDEVMVRQFASSAIRFETAGVRVRLTQTTAYPEDGMIELKVEPERPVEFRLRLRVPGWALAPEVLLNGRPATPLMSRRWVGGDRVTLRFSMPPGWRQK